MPLAAWLIAIAWPIAKKVLSMLGIGWVSYQGVVALTSSVVSAAQQNWSQASGAVLQISSIGGVPEMLGIVTGALVARASFIVLEKLTKIAT